MLILIEKIPFHRLGALIDGVFAIVMTILVLDIKVPHDMAVFKSLSLEHFLTGQFQDIVIYMVVFMVLAYLWIINHSESHFIKFTDYVHLWLTILCLMFVALLPFSSALVNKYPQDEIAELFLAGNVLIIGIFNYISWAYIIKRPALLESTLTEKQTATEKKKLLIMPLVAVMAMAVALIYPLGSSYTLLLAPVAMFFMELRWGARNKR
ncbi:MAG: TMEM175 family protein [Candidatus Omnitrophota bacterium]